MNITDEHVTNILNDKVPGRNHQELSFMFMVRCARWVPNTVITGTPKKRKPTYINADIQINLLLQDVLFAQWLLN